MSILRMKIVSRIFAGVSKGGKRWGINRGARRFEKHEPIEMPQRYRGPPNVFLFIRESGGQHSERKGHRRSEGLYFAARRGTSRLQGEGRGREAVGGTR